MSARGTSEPPCETARKGRLAWWTGGAAVLGALVYLMATAHTGPVDPTAVSGPQSRTTVVANSAIIVFREGLEAILILAAVTASFLGANARRRRPVAAGAGVAFAAAVGTWFIAQALLAAASPLGMKLEAITGLIAVIVLLVVLNWFLHKVYWTGWIARHHRRRRSLLAASGLGATAGLVSLGFTSVFREGVEVVLFLQNLQLKAGSGVVLEGVGIGLAATAVVGVITFVLQRKLPYKKMLIATGVLIGVVLVVMIGGTAATFQDLGWLPRHELPIALPAWLGTWFEIRPYWETTAIQVLAAAFVIGSYFAAERRLVAAPQRRGDQPAVRPEAPPLSAAEAA